MRTGKVRAVLRGHDDWVSKVAFSPNGHFLVSAGYDKPFTSLEDGMADYVKGYLSQPDPYR